MTVLVSVSCRHQSPTLREHGLHSSTRIFYVYRAVSLFTRQLCWYTDFTEKWPLDLDGWLHNDMFICQQTVTHPSTNRARRRTTRSQMNSIHCALLDWHLHYYHEISPFSQLPFSDMHYRYIQHIIATRKYGVVMCSVAYVCVSVCPVLVLNPFTADPVKAYTLPYWSNPPFLIFDILALCRSVLSARAPECQKLKMVG